MAQKVVDYNAIAPNFSSVKDQIDRYGGGGSSEDIENLKAVFCSEEYDPTKTYTSGYVWYDGDLYQCIAKPWEPATGPFNPSDWRLSNDMIAYMIDLINTIGGRVNAVKYALAPDFNDATEYATGTYVWYDGVLYKFESNHTEGPWIEGEAIECRGNDGALNM